MNAQLLDSSAREATQRPPSVTQTASVKAAAEHASRRIAPLWPLKDFVAVNPFLGLSSKPFAQASQTMATSAGARMTMPRSFYAEALASGRIAEADLAAALIQSKAAAGLTLDFSRLKQAIDNPNSTRFEPNATVADVAGRVTGRDWSTLVVDRISFWAASYFDEGQAAWVSSLRNSPPYSAWRQDAMIDRTPELMGLRNFRGIVQSLPDNADAMLVEGIRLLGIGVPDFEAYFHRLLMRVGGWASYARYQVWQSELQGDKNACLTELLAVCIAWEVALLESHRSRDAFVDAWNEARRCWRSADEPDSEFVIDEILQSAYEIAWQRGLLASLSETRSPVTGKRKRIQAAFCIDVRSEVFRRAFERTSPDIETIGFAGFFGFPIEFVPLGEMSGRAQCPVLLTPRFIVCETVLGAQAPETERILGLRILRRRVANAWRAFKMAAVSSFGFVETMGWTYLGKLASDGLGFSRTVVHPAADGIDAAITARLSPRITAHEIDGRMTGFTPAEQIAMAEAVLTAMSLREGFARVVMLVGHGSTTVNNPHARGLDCGACGGHSGEANARVAAAILNLAWVRRELGARGIRIPEDTIFLGCLHDTSTDEVTVFNSPDVPASHQHDLVHLHESLQRAGRSARRERAPRLNLDPGSAIDAQIIARTRDWSQLRPEWGLAGCAAFIAAPRMRTEAIDLHGRVFLNSYDWRQDEGFRVLELIMTAPMIVASWISLQYFGSTVDNRVFGCGNKVLHNVVGTLGVLEGNGGDLRSGLPWQSVHDGERLIHEPMRLSVVIAAPIEAINAVIVKHEVVRELVEHGWIHLFAMADTPSPIRRYSGLLQWTDSA